MRIFRQAIVVALSVALSNCSSPTESREQLVRGLGFYFPITDQAISQLERVGTVLTVVHSAKVVLIESAASPADLERIQGVTAVGPPLGPLSGLQLEASVIFPETPTPDQMVALAAAGTITSELPQAHWYILLVPVEKLSRLDEIVGAIDVSVLIDHAVRI